MPEVVVRKRAGRRSGDWKYRLSRWSYRNRPRIAVVVAFLAACVVGLAVASVGLRNSSSGGGEPDSSAPTEPTE